MTVPVTTLDAVYSDPAASAVSWEETLRAIETAELWWVSTVRVDGRPHVTPVVAVWHDGAVWFATGADEQKRANMGANPAVVLTTGCNRWDSGLDVVVEGRARRVADDAILAPVAARFVTRWDGRWKYVAGDGAFRDEEGNGEALVFAVTPVKVFAHAKGDPFGATCHRFGSGPAE